MNPVKIIRWGVKLPVVANDVKLSLCGDTGRPADNADFQGPLALEQDPVQLTRRGRSVRVPPRNTD